jgi:hypothetical protein
VATSKDWPRLANAVRTRRTELGLTQEDVRAAGGPSTSIMRMIEGSLQSSYRPNILHRLEVVMQWRPGSVRVVLAGGHPVPLEDQPPAPAPAAAPAARVPEQLSLSPLSPPPDPVLSHLLAALAVSVRPLARSVLAEVAAGQPFTHPVERLIWGLPDWPAERKAAEIAVFRARRAEFDGGGLAERAG